jgi:hypothetical protein
MFFSAFGAAWLSWGDLIARGGIDWTLLPIIAVGGALFATAWRHFRANKGARDAFGSTPRARRIARVFHVVNAGQWVLIFVLANVLNNAGLKAWIVPMVIAIAGAHFLPLALVMRYRAHYVSGVALLTLAVVYPLAAPSGPLSAAGPLGAGLILWASAAYGLTAGGDVRQSDVNEVQVV